MKKNILDFSESRAMFKKHPLIFLLLVGQVALCFYLSLSMFVQLLAAQGASDKFERVYTKDTLYSLGEYLDDVEYMRNLNDDGERYRKAYALASGLRAQTEYPYMAMATQPLEAPAPDAAFLYGYEAGDAQAGMLKSIQVSSGFFSQFELAVQGRDFSPQDYLYEAGKTRIPVILGDAYHEYYALGDTFEGDYLFERFTFEVVGFLEKDAFFYAETGRELVSLARYAVLPSMMHDTDQPTDIDRIRLLQALPGQLNAGDASYADVQAWFARRLALAGLGDWAVMVNNPARHEVSMDVLSQYQGMTDTVKRQFYILFAIMLGTAFLSISMTISRLIRERIYEYAVRLMCGAPGNVLEASGRGALLILLLCGGTLGVLCLRTRGAALMLLALAVLLALYLVNCLLLHWMLRGIDLVKVIGGKE